MTWIWLKQNWIKVGIVAVILIFSLFLIPTKQRASISIYSTPSREALLQDECRQLVEDQKDDAKLILNNNEFALKILEENCLWVMSHATAIDDFDGDGKNEIAMVTSGAGCGSCHGQEIRIIKDDKIVFYKSGTEFTIQQAKNSIGFILFQEDFPERIEEVYAYNKESESFVKTSEQKTILEVD